MVKGSVEFENEKPRRSSSTGEVVRRRAGNLSRHPYQAGSDRRGQCSPRSSALSSRTAERVRCSFISASGERSSARPDLRHHAERFLHERPG